MKDKRIWIVIGCILVIGTGVTHYTKYYVKSQGEAMMAETTAGAGDMTMKGTSLASVPDKTEQQAEQYDGNGGDASPAQRRMDGMEGAGAAESGAAFGAAAAKSVPDADRNSPSGGTWEETIAADSAALPEQADQAAVSPEAETASAENTPISPLTGAKAREYKASLLVDYRKRLEDLDNQILKMREEETDSNVYSIKTSADSELKMWESELNTIYNALLEMLPQENAAKLASEQQDWLKNRDARAAENSGKGSGGSVDGIGYAATLASLTRDRAYELAGRYEEANGVSLEEEASPSPSP